MVLLNAHVTTAAPFDYSYQCMHVVISPQRPCSALRRASSGGDHSNPCSGGEFQRSLPETGSSKAISMSWFILDNAMSLAYLRQREIALDMDMSTATWRGVQVPAAVGSCRASIQGSTVCPAKHCSCGTPTPQQIRLSTATLCRTSAALTHSIVFGAWTRWSCCCPDNVSVVASQTAGSCCRSVVACVDSDEETGLPLYQQCRLPSSWFQYTITTRTAGTAGSVYSGAWSDHLVCRCRASCYRFRMRGSAQGGSYASNG